MRHFLFSESRQLAASGIPGRQPRNSVREPNAQIFADIFNHFIYGGRQVIQPEQLSECDPTEIALPYGDGQAPVPVQKYRDVQKMCAMKTDGETEYVLYGAESQLCKALHNWDSSFRRRWRTARL